MPAFVHFNTLKEGENMTIHTYTIIAIGYAIGKCITDIREDPMDINAYICFIILIIAGCFNITR